MRFFVLLIAVILTVCKGSLAEPIEKLPGLQFDVNFKHYSGFLKASNTHFLHYWFVESQRTPTNDPLVFWFNGGPGCSSLDGLLNEMGPYVVNPDGKTLRSNPNAWNKISNMVYIEAPAGVGYSYSTDGNTATDDDQTSMENYEAIKQFFTIHPEFRNHSVFIFAESYGGVYGPTLTTRIIDGQKDFPIKIKGMALGNGYVNAKLNIDTSVRYAYGHGIIDEKVWNTLEVECCRGCIDGCDLTAVTGHCGRMVEDIFNFLWVGGLNPYDLYRNCDPNPSVNSIKMNSLKLGLVPRFIQERFSANYTKNLFKLHKSSSKRRNVGYIPRYGASVPCMNDTDMLTYMNSQEVRKALHIPDDLGAWDICNDKISLTYNKTYGDMTPFIKKIIDNQVRVMLYYGDTDMACNFMMGQQFSAKLGLKRQLNKTPWKFDKQIGGFKTQYKGLTFVTIRGAGHMAPQWRAPQMYYVFEQFLLNHPI